ncbi:MAG: hypothetical protein WB807_01325 [Candidatus Dormiibacterota bacterium]
MPDEEAPASYKADTVEFILNHTRGVPVRQTQTMDALDGKAGQLFAAASLVLGFSGLLLAHPHRLHPIQAGLIFGALGVYLGAVTFIVFAVNPRRYRLVDHATTLWEDYKTFTPEQIRGALVREIPEVAAFNQGIIIRKATCVRWLVRCVAVEALCVAVAIAISVV